MKTYKFRKTDKITGQVEDYELKEDQLNKTHEDMMLGNILKEYYELPVKIQKKFRTLIRSLKITSLLP